MSDSKPTKSLDNSTALYFYQNFKISDIKMDKSLLFSKLKSKYLYPCTLAPHIAYLILCHRDSRHKVLLLAIWILNTISDRKDTITCEHSTQVQLIKILKEQNTPTLHVNASDCRQETVILTTNFITLWFYRNSVR